MGNILKKCQSSETVEDFRENQFLNQVTYNRFPLLEVTISNASFENHNPNQGISTELLPAIKSEKTSRVDESILRSDTENTDVVSGYRNPSQKNKCRSE